MKATFDSVTLFDDAALFYGSIEQLGGQDVVQTETVYGQADVAKFPRGNVGGQFVFTAGFSYASYDAAGSAFATAYNLLDTQDDLVLFTDAAGSHKLTFADAILHQVQRIEWDGLWLKIRYTFEITTVAYS